MSVNNPEDLKRRAEIDRLLSLANVQRLRGDFITGEDNCRKVLDIDPENLQARELLADFLYERGKLEEAAERYKALLEQGPKRAALEEKYARAVLEMGEREHQKAIALDMIENPAKYAPPQRSSLVSILLTAVAPGFGHVYIGDYTRGLIIFGVFILSWMIVAFSPGTSLFAQQLGDYIRDPRMPANYNVLSPFAILFAGVGFFTYIYAIIDAAVLAGKPKDNRVS